MSPFSKYVFVPLNGVHAKCPCYIKIPTFLKPKGELPHIG